MKPIREKMRETDIKLTGERLKLAETCYLEHPEEDFCCYSRDFDEDNVSCDVFEITKRADFLEVRFKDEFIIASMEQFSDFPHDDAPDILTQYMRIRLDSLKDHNLQNDKFLENIFARTIALNAIPRKITTETCMLNLAPRMSQKQIAGLFYRLDQMKSSAKELDSRLLTFVRRYLQ